MLTNIKNIALAVSIALTVGYCTGYYTKSQFVKADQFESVVEARHQTAKDIQQSLEQSSAVEKQITDYTNNITNIRKVVTARTKESSNDANLRIACPDSLFDVGTVRLLNSARSNTAIDATAINNVESEGASGLTLPELLENDLEIVSLYHELAARHNALVDYVTEQIQKQAQ